MADGCCTRMAEALDFSCDQHADLFDCPDALILRSASGGFGLIIHDGGSAYIEISHCPWCGTQLSQGTARSVFLLQHERSAGATDSNVKVIGVYTTRAEAEAAIVRLSSQPGFQDHPDGFSIDPYPLDADHWQEGFGPKRAV